MTNRDTREIREKLMHEIRVTYECYFTVIKYASVDLTSLQSYGYIMVGRISMCIDLLEELEDYDMISENSINLLRGFLDRFRRSLKELEVL